MRHNYQPLKRKFGAFVIAVSLFELGGCASYTQKLDVGNYYVDCNHPEESRIFLEKLKNRVQAEAWKAELELKFNPFATDRDYKANLAHGGEVNEINNKIGDLYVCSWRAEEQEIIKRLEEERRVKKELQDQRKQERAKWRE
jgi:hypothetical protein